MRILLYIILLLPLLINSFDILSQKDFLLVEKFFTSNLNDYKILDSIDDTYLKNVLKKIAINEFLKRKEFEKIVDIEFELKEKYLNILLKNQTDTSLLNYFINRGIKIQNYTVELNYALTDKQKIKSFVLKYPVDKISIKFFKENPSSFDFNDSIFILIKNFSNENFFDLVDTLNITPLENFFVIFKKDDSLEIKNIINSNFELFDRMEDKNFKIRYSKFLNEQNLKGNYIYFLGRYYEKNKEYKKALELYRKVKDDEAILRIIAILRNENIVEIYDSIMRNYNGNDVNFLYHKAKYLYNVDKKSSDSIFEIVSRNFPFSLYSVRSFIHLKKKIEFVDVKYSKDSLLLKLFQLFAENGYSTFLKDYLNELYRENSVDRDYLIYLFDKFGFYNYSIYYSENMIKSGKDYKKYLKFLFPTPYLDIFKKIGEEENIDHCLLLALAREESSFSKDAISSASAKGIMQLMNFVYDSFYKDKDYFDEEKNIRVGARHLKNYLKEFPDSPSEALMAYNVGVNTVKRWKRKYSDWELFIESIPYLETKNFVKKVLRSYYFYKFVLKVS